MVDALTGKSRNIWLPISLLIGAGLIIYLYAFLQPLGQEQIWRCWLAPTQVFLHIPLWANSIIAFVTSILIVISIQAVCMRHTLVSRKNIMPAYFSLLVIAIIQFQQPDAISSLSAWFLVISFSLLLDLFEQPHHKNLLLSAALLGGLAAIVDIRVIALLPLYWFILVLFRNTQWRMWIIVMIGFLLPLFFIGMTLFLFYDGIQWPKPIIDSLTTLVAPRTIDWIMIQGIALFSIPVLASMLELISGMKAKKISQRKYLWTAIIAGIYLLLLVIFSEQSSNRFLLLLLLTVSALIFSSSIANWRRKIIRELTILYIFAAVVVDGLLIMGVIVL